VHRAPGTPVPGRVDRDCSMSVRRDKRRSGGVSFERGGGGRGDGTRGGRR